MTADHQLLVGRDDVKGDATARARDYGPVRVRLRIELCPEPGEVLGDSRAHSRRVLADPSREHEAVDSTERRSQPASLEADAIREIIEAKPALGSELSSSARTSLLMPDNPLSPLSW